MPEPARAVTARAPEAQSGRAAAVRRRARSRLEISREPRAPSRGVESSANGRARRRVLRRSFPPSDAPSATNGASQPRRSVRCGTPSSTSCWRRRTPTWLASDAMIRISSLERSRCERSMISAERSTAARSRRPRRRSMRRSQSRGWSHPLDITDGDRLAGRPRRELLRFARQPSRSSPTMSMSARHASARPLPRTLNCSATQSGSFRFVTS